MQITFPPRKSHGSSAFGLREWRALTVVLLDKLREPCAADRRQGGRDGLLRA
jgi:hypothetical protein